MPTPPAGDIAWAASPMQSIPSTYQRRSRLSRTSSQWLDFLRLVEAIDESTGVDIPERDYTAVTT